MGRSQFMTAAVDRATRWRPSSQAALGLAEAAMVAVLGVQTARIFWVFAAPPGPLGQVTAAAQATPAFNPAIFGRFDPFYRNGAPEAVVADQTVPGEGAFRLYGVRVEAGGRGSAILASPDGRQNSFATGEEVAPGVVLTAVFGDHVILTRRGGDQTLAFESLAPPPPQPSSAARVETSAPVVGLPPPAAAGGAIDRGRLLAQMGLSPRRENGRVSGFQVLPRAGGAALRQAGLQAGDVILSLNGQELTTENLAEQVQELRNAPEAVIRFQRGDEVMTTTLQASRP